MGISIGNGRTFKINFFIVNFVLLFKFYKHDVRLTAMYIVFVKVCVIFVRVLLLCKKVINYFGNKPLVLHIKIRIPNTVR